MANFKASPSPKPIEIDRFLGLNESVGETEINLGESVKQVNFRITQNFKPQKRKGHNTFIDFGNAKDVQGMWHGEIANKEVLIFINNGNVYEYDMASTSTNTLIADLILDGSVTLIGTLTDAKTTIFYFDSKLYFMNGVEYKEYDGTTFQEVIPYVPTVAIGTPPAGGGTPQDPLNLLTGKARQEFFADGVATLYVLSASGLDVDTVLCTINGVSKTEGTDFTVDRTLGKVTFSVAPADEAEVIIEWAKNVVGNADIVKKNRFAMANGPGNDTAVFIWGNPEHKNRRSWSGTLKANYFPVINYTYIGSDEFAITDIAPQYDRQIIFKEDRTHYSYPEWNATAKAWDYPVYDLKDSVGNIAFDQVQLIKNNPVSLHNQALWEWSNTATKDERDSDIISYKIRESLSTLDLSQAVTFDLQRQNELWVNVGSMVYIYNYGNGTFYTYDNVSGTCYLDIKQTVYYGSQGTIERFEGEDDNGVAVTAQLILGFADWGAMEYRKNTREIFVGLLPDSHTSVNVYYRTNRINEFRSISKLIEYHLLDFNNIDFNNFSFLTNRNPQTFRRKVRAKKYTYIQFQLENKELGQVCTIISLMIQAEQQGFER